MTLTETIHKIIEERGNRSKIARLRGRLPKSSGRDMKTLLKYASELDMILEEFGFEITEI